ncbi:bifunctional adenosylcobinamide kinase/adenosylcobinamide-phosphate guanylyltransferase [Halobacillus sp. Marseille-Q1614]|uniref:bifunctional adenosylcobinamide kinase/adenosylcobinamide-phosphate guanylyltransferase n=1 Tax=Halobacillus sp. Marseille-Q1614 TaxID=2709134 RepID=UPI00156F57E1|nr:bifunctional adenosylcobinamide kinase/adenosylcobinamide-phosphate guanylyltransferase [Halobacillus sp. Marseille-Q1614]
MQLVVGGAYAGKRKWVREKFYDAQWFSAYDNQPLAQWEQIYENSSSSIVIEGWEVWVRQEWEKVKELEPVRKHFESIIADMKIIEKQRKQPIVLIMLEVGRGIVPVDKDERAWRDLCGWVLQNAAALSEEVHYCWHGLSRQLK